MPARHNDTMVTVGRIVGLYGVRGWVKIRSYTQPPENILSYQPWSIGAPDRWREARVQGGRVHGKGIVAQLAGSEDRDTARELIGADIAVHRGQLPPVEADHYYWTDLVGLQVRDPSGRSLGTVDYVMATGANDVLVVTGERERLIPFIKDQVIKQVDLEGGTLTADWDPDF